MKTLRIRNTGRTVRLADHYIQILFLTGEVICNDEIGSSNGFAYEFTSRRLVLEHGTENFEFIQQERKIKLGERLMKQQTIKIDSDCFHVKP